MVGGTRKFGDAILLGSFSGGAAAPIAWPAGTGPRDWAVIAVTTGVPAGAWTEVTGAAAISVRLFIRHLTSADLISPLVPGLAFCGVVLRDISAVEYRARFTAQASGGAASNQLGFVKASNCGGRLGVIRGMPGYAFPSMSTFTVATTQTNGASVWAIALNLNSAAFVSGAGVDLAWDVTDPSGSAWAMFEILRASDV